MGCSGERAGQPDPSVNAPKAKRHFSRRYYNLPKSHVKSDLQTYLAVTQEEIGQ